MDKKILITSALPYVNNTPHLGNIIGCVLSADAYSRFMKQKYGDNVLFVCGTDEYGTTTEVKALEEGLTCKQICDKYHQIHKKIYDWFNIDFDVFGRTTTDTQTELAQEIFLELYDKGFFEEKEETQLKCLECNKFLADRYVYGFCYHSQCSGKDIKTKGDQCDSCRNLIDAYKLKDPICKMCHGTPTAITSTHLYLKLAEFEDELRTYFIDEEKCDLSKNALETTRGLLNSGLLSRPMTRDLVWGTPVPTDRPGLEKFSGKVLFVWFDAPIGYLSIIKHSRDDWETWFNCDEWVQFMAKDNIQFHSVIFPATVMGFNKDRDSKKLPIVTKLNAVEYLNCESGKFSKSEGVGIFGDHAKDISKKLGIDEDYWRFYLFSIRPEGNDSTFKWTDFINLSNAVLVNNYGNYSNRCISLCKKYFKEENIYFTKPHPDSWKYHNKLESLLEQYEEEMRNCHLNPAIKLCFEMSALGNEYLQSHKPWVLYSEFKKTGDENTKELVRSTLKEALHILRVATHSLSPFIPKTAEYIESYIGYTGEVYTISSDKYKLPFKPLEIDEVRKVLEELKIKS